MNEFTNTTDEVIMRAVDLLTAGMPESEVANHLGISDIAVSVIAEEFWKSVEVTQF